MVSLLARSCEGLLQQNIARCSVVLQVRNARARAALGLPEKPKKPPNPWLLFLSERRCELMLQAEFEECSVVEMSKKISEEWRNFDELDKIPYKEKYEESLGHYKRQMEEYKGNLTAEDKRILRNIKLEEKQDIKAFEKEFPKPKYQGNGYILFVKSCLKENPRGEREDIKDWIRKCAQRWQNLDEGTKMKLNEEAGKHMEKYKEELEDWREKYKEWKKSDLSR